MNSIMQHLLPTAWEKALALIFRQSEFVCDLAFDIRNAGFAKRGELEDGQHHCLIVGNRHE